MSNQQHPKQQNRPSLYEPRETTSAFSILGTDQPLGWPKQKSIGLAIISFITGGVLSGGAVGLIQSTDQPISQIPELATTHVVPKGTPQSTLTQIVSPPLSHQNPDITASHLVAESKTISTAPVVKNPLASFKDDPVQINTTPKQHVQANSHANAVVAKDDAELQQLIQRKTQHGNIAATTNEKLEKSKLSAVALMQNKKIKTEHPNSNMVVKQKKPLPHDKDVLLVKSMLDTMDHPLSVNITTRAKPPEGDINH